MTRQQARRVTMAQVARHAGVSVATVSRVLSAGADGPISEATRALVTASVAELGYRVDPIGRALRSRMTASIGLVVPDIGNPFFPALIRAVEAVARRSASSLLLTDSQDDVDVERAVTELLLARRVDALLISPVHRQRSRATVQLAAGVTRTVQIDRLCSGDVDYVGTDHAGAIGEVITHLVESGRRRIGFAGADRSEYPAHRREAAYTRLVSRAVIVRAPATIAGGRSAIEELLRLDRRLDAVVCSNDLIAAGVLAGLEDRGIVVPGDVAVTGYDDTLVAGVCRPVLTTVAQPIEAIAERALALAAQPQAERPTRVALPARLILGPSSAGPER